MNRRDFLLFRSDGEMQIAELSCEKLYMRFSDRKEAGKFGQNESGLADDAEWWSGEPSTEFITGDQQSLSDSILAELSNADILRINGKQWLAAEDFATFVKDLAGRFAVEDKQVIYADQ